VRELHPGRRCVLVLACCASCAVPLASNEQAITGGVADTGDPAVVEMRYAGDQQCTASIVAPRVALTAGHCVTDVRPGDAVTLFTGPDDARAGGDTLAVAEMHAHPRFDPAVNRYDIAVLILAAPTAISPLAYYRGPLDAAMTGRPLRLVGYGDNTVVDPTSGAGVKRQVSASLAGFDDDVIRVGARDATQCYGDSGGPALLAIDGVETIVGVDSTQDDDNCDGLNSDTRVDAYADFIDGYVAEPAGCDAGGGGGLLAVVAVLYAVFRSSGPRPRS
jgi:secreted trypsin-like serine protease